MFVRVHTFRAEVLDFIGAGAKAAAEPTRRVVRAAVIFMVS